MFEDSFNSPPPNTESPVVPYLSSLKSCFHLVFISSTDNYQACRSSNMRLKDCADLIGHLARHSLSAIMVAHRECYVLEDEAARKLKFLNFFVGDHSSTSASIHRPRHERCQHTPPRLTSWRRRCKSDRVGLCLSGVVWFSCCCYSLSASTPGPEMH